MPASLLHAFGLLIFASAWLAYDHYRPWVNFHSEALAIFSIGLLAFSRLSRPARQAPMTSPSWLWILIALAVIPWLQWFAGVSLFAGDALLASLYLCAFAVAVALGYTYARDERGSDLTSIFFLVWVIALISAIIGLLQWLGLQEALAMYVVQTDFGDRAMGNLGQPNQLATLLLMGLAALVWIYERKHIGGLGLAFGAGFLTLVLVLSQSRAGVVSGLAVAVYLTWKTSRSAMRLRPKQIAIWTASYLVALQLLPWVHELLMMAGRRDMSLMRDNGRITIWKQVLAGTLESPWYGFGWNQTPSAHAAGAIAFPGSLTYTNAHNVVLDLIAWNGIPLGLLLTLMCTYWLASRLLRASEPNGIYALASLIPIGIHSLLEYPFAYAYFLVAGALMVGITEAHHPQSKKRFVLLSRPLLAIFIAAWLALGCRIVYEYVQVEEDFRVVRFENLRIGRTPAEYQPPNDIYLLSQLGTMLDASRLRPARNMDPADIEKLRTASLRFAYGALAVRYALSLGLNGQPQAASKQMQVIRGMYGDYYYQAAIDVLRSMENEQYPELKAVLTP